MVLFAMIRLSANIELAVPVDDGRVLVLVEEDMTFLPMQVCRKFLDILSS